MTSNSKRPAYLLNDPCSVSTAAIFFPSASANTSMVRLLPLPAGPTSATRPRASYLMARRNSIPLSACAVLCVCRPVLETSGATAVAGLTTCCRVSFSACAIDSARAGSIRWGGVVIVPFVPFSIFVTPFAVNARVRLQNHVRTSPTFSSATSEQVFRRSIIDGAFSAMAPHA